mmetsp:Transcript_7055/g.19149  ORF Transcript_7055/g.19149 Transcript_7055/m.19149 type:complete len:224 (-) Transcript_7055:183-854(-)
MYGTIYAPMHVHAHAQCLFLGHDGLELLIAEQKDTRLLEVDVDEVSRSVFRLQMRRVRDLLVEVLALAQQLAVVVEDLTRFVVGTRLDEIDLEMVGIGGRAILVHDGDAHRLRWLVVRDVGVGEGQGDLGIEQGLAQRLAAHEGGGDLCVKEEGRDDEVARHDLLGRRRGHGGVGREEDLVVVKDVDVVGQPRAALRVVAQPRRAFAGFILIEGEDVVELRHP